MSILNNNTGLFYRREKVIIVRQFKYTSKRKPYLITDYTLKVLRKRSVELFIYLFYLSVFLICGCNIYFTCHISTSKSSVFRFLKEVIRIVYIYIYIYIYIYTNIYIYVCVCVCALGTK
jgi:hypothetical protein